MTDRGFASPILVALLALAALMSLAFADAANVLVSRVRAQDAADAAALAAVAAQWPFLHPDEQPEEAAAHAAERHGAILQSCDCPLRSEHAKVVVAMRTRIRMLGIAPSEVVAQARATMDIDRIFAPQR